MNYFRNVLAAVFAALALAVSAAQASTLHDIKITSVSGTWSGIDVLRANKPHGYPDKKGVRKSYNPKKDAGKSRIRWGWTWDEGPSAYVFKSAKTPISVADPLGGSVSYVLGEFTHENRTIVTGGPRLLSAVLDLKIKGNIGGTEFSYTPSFKFTHDETPNAGNKKGVCKVGKPPCADIVKISKVLKGENSFTVDGVTYRMYLEGFLDKLGNPSRTFFTKEHKDNSRDIRWRIERDPTTPPPPVPLPAGVWLMLGGIGALGTVAHRRKTT